MIPNCIRNVGATTSRRNVASLLFKKNNYATEASFETKPVKLHRLDSGPSTKVTINRDEALKMYEQMQTSRRIETAAGNLYKEKIIRGFCHLYSGQEAIAVGMMQVLRQQDAVITAYRAHSWTYLMGVSPLGVMAELTGRQSGCARGKGGSMHMYAKNFYGGNGIVGAQVPLGVGIAFAQKYLNTGGVCIALYGDGAANQGQIFEVYNMAKLWDIPCIFVCENNGYAMGTSVDRGAASTDYYTRGDYVPGILVYRDQHMGYSEQEWINSISVDGMDVMAVKEATQFAIDYCTSGKGPLVLEAKTYRYSGHSMSDPGTSYRTREEVQEVRQTRDPITSFKEKIINSGLVTADELKKLEKEIKNVVDEAVKLAKADKEIPLSELTADIYSNCLEKEIRNTTPLQPLQHSRLGPAVNA